MEALKTALNAYTEATISNDVPTLIDFVYPKVFTVVPKEKMTQVLRAAYATGRMPTIKEVKHIHIEPTKEYDTGVFSVITSNMISELKSPRPQNAKIEADMLKMLKKELARSNGSVTFNPESHTFTVNHTDQTIAINEDSGWKFAGVNQAKKYAERGLLPQIIVEILP